MVFVFILVLNACNRPVSTPPNVNEHTQRVLVQASEVLFFHNIRSLYYQKSENEATQIRTYTLKEMPDQCRLYMLIQHAYIREEAYIALKTTIPTEEICIVWKDNKQQMKGTICHTLGYPIKDYLFAKKLIHWHNKGIKLLWDDIPLFTEASFKAFNTVFQDYAKLIAVK